MESSLKAIHSQGKQYSLDRKDQKALEPKQPTCKYGGQQVTITDTNCGIYTKCGEDGWLCKMCEQDRADARVKPQPDMSLLLKENCRLKAKINRIDDQTTCRINDVFSHLAKLTEQIAQLDFVMNNHIYPKPTPPPTRRIINARITANDNNNWMHPQNGYVVTPDSYATSARKIEQIDEYTL